MAEEWLTYKQLAGRLNVSPDAARRRAHRHGWPRRTGAGGKVLVLVDPPAPAEVADAGAVESHITALKEMVARAETLAERYRDRAVGGRLRADALRAVADAARADGEAERDRADALAARIHTLLSHRSGERATGPELEPQVEELRAIVRRMINAPRWWRRPPG